VIHATAINRNLFIISPPLRNHEHIGRIFLDHPFDPSANGNQNNCQITRRFFVFELLQVKGSGFFPMFAGMAIQLIACCIDYSLSTL
jgi:hypothetical protein